ncbi:transglycosylase SLT domain-containing protein [bacterium]|nr:transglycosylase SLT domain-containing protein [bacterium]
MRISSIFHAVALVAGLAALPAAAYDAKEISALQAAQRLADQQDWEGAGAAAMAAGPVGADVIEWERLRAGQGLLGDYETFLARRPDWPGLSYLKAQGEVAVARSQDPDRVLAYFGSDKPQSASGALALIAALEAKGRHADAVAEATRAWTELPFSAEEQTRILAGYARDLKVADEVRLDRILWQGGRADEAQRMLPLVSKGWATLATARLALRANKPGVTALIAAVPASLRDDPGLAFERFLFRMRQNNYADAATLIIERSSSAKKLGDPAEWADKRASLARYIMRTGDPRIAYKVASTHQLRDPKDYADLEFLSGFIALRKLNDPARAMQHFSRLMGATTPISQARALYWMGRAQEAAGDKAKAQTSYAQAAQLHTTYYGLLAAEKLGQSFDATLVSNAPPAGDWKTARFARSSVLEAALRLADAGNEQLSARFLLHLGESLSDQELGTLAAMALQMKQYRSAVLIAKVLAEHGIIVSGAYFPMPDMVPDNLAVSRALALSIARRESEFDPEARSSAGALGLMQLLPATAAKVAKDQGLTYSASRLASDPVYNATLGAAYLKEMVDKFGPAVALIASGYNAGPGRPQQWIAAFGDPRLASVDPVDWVETIPFNETRTYVMRVAEGVVVYRAKLRGSPGPVNITSELTGR